MKKVKIKLFHPLNNENRKKLIMMKSSSVSNIKIINKKSTDVSLDNKLKSSSKRKIKLPKIELYNNINNNIKSRLGEIKNSNFFVTVDNNIHLNKNKMKIPQKPIKSKPKEDKEDNNLNIDAIISKFEEEYKNDMIEKRNKQKNIINKIYGINSQYIRNLNFAKKRKYLTLKDYQINILEAYSQNRKYSDKSIYKLSDIFKNIREDIEGVVPYPKINLNSIFNHFKSHNKIHRIKSVKSYINEIPKPKDDFEKEELLINSLKIRKKRKQKVKANLFDFVNRF